MNNLKKIIKEIINQFRVRNHNELILLLKQRGINIAQSNLSIKLRKFNILRRVDENGESYYWAPHENIKVSDSIYSYILRITNNESSIVLSVHPGTSRVIAQLIDERFPQEFIIGTIAGDDTILIIPASHKLIKQLVTDLKIFFKMES